MSDPLKRSYSYSPTYPPPYSPTYPCNFTYEDLKGNEEPLSLFSKEGNEPAFLPMSDSSDSSVSLHSKIKVVACFVLKNIAESTAIGASSTFIWVALGGAVLGPLGVIGLGLTISAAAFIILLLFAFATQCYKVYQAISDRDGFDLLEFKNSFKDLLSEEIYQEEPDFDTPPSTKDKAYFILSNAIASACLAASSAFIWGALGGTVAGPLGVVGFGLTAAATTFVIILLIASAIEIKNCYDRYNLHVQRDLLVDLEAFKHDLLEEEVVS